MHVEQMAAAQILLADAPTQAANNPSHRSLSNSCYWPQRKGISKYTAFCNDRNKVIENINKRETFFWFRVSVSIEKKMADKTNQSWSYLKGTSYIKFFSLPISINQRGIVLNIKRNTSISIWQQKLLLETLQVTKIADINVEERKILIITMFCFSLRVFYRQKM